MKTCISTYSFGKYADILGINGVIDKAAEMGFDGIEFVDGGWTDNLSLSTAKELRKRAEDRGLSVVAYCTGNDFLDGGSLSQKVDNLKKQADFAAALGVKNMRHDVSYCGERIKKSYSDVLPILAEGCRLVTEYAKTLDLGTMTENHGWFSQDSARVEQLVSAVDNDNFGLLVDMGNFMCADESPVHAVGVTAKYAKHVHCKDFLFKSGAELHPGNGWFETRGGDYLRGAILGHGVVPVPQCLHVLKKYGYDGFVSIEFEGIEDNLLGIEWGLAYLKRCFELL